MKHIIPLILIVPVLCLCSCRGLNVFGTQVEVVNNRAPDGTYLPANKVVNAAGEIPDSFASLYHYPSGNLGVSGYAGVLQGQFPRLAKK